MPKDPETKATHGDPKSLPLEMKRKYDAEYLRNLVIEQFTNGNGRLIKIGLGQTERGEVLGIDRHTIRRWDYQNDTPRVPTHARSSDGKVYPVGSPGERKGMKRWRRTTRYISPAERKPVWYGRLTAYLRRPVREQRNNIIEIRHKAEMALAILDREEDPGK